jgi:hypothetical protein
VWFAAQEDYARSCGAGVGENLWKIEVVRQHYVSGVIADFPILRLCGTKGGPVASLMTCAVKVFNPTRCQVHVDENAHQLARRISWP